MGPVIPNLRTCAAAPLSVGLGVLALFFAMSWDLTLKVTSDAPANVHVTAPEVHWIFYALPAIVLFVAFVVLLKRTISAWRGRKQPRPSSRRSPNSRRSNGGSL